MPLLLLTVEVCRNYLIRLKLCQIYVIQNALLELVASRGNSTMTPDQAKHFPVPLPLLEGSTIKIFIDFFEFASPRCG